MTSFLQTGQTLKHYAVLGKIGQGGMGQVYKAEDQKLGRTVAVKLLPEAAARSETARQRLLQEARSASVLNHPGIVTIHAIEEHEGVNFIVMEYVVGEIADGVRDGHLRDVFLNSAPVREVFAGARVANALELHFV